MDPIRRIVICGTSILAMAIEVNLGSLSELDIVRLDPHLPGAVDRITAMKPDVVLLERDLRPEGLVLTLLGCGCLLLELDAATGVLSVLDRHLVPVRRIDDLVQVIGEALPATRHESI
jgi:hypothetical protein